jgi:lipopolysaccharide/colanic/teichoic acid biosynthesis glycosyltransferase
VERHFERADQAERLEGLVLRAIASAGHPGWYARGGKRMLDLLVALPAAAVLCPVMAVVWLLVRWRLGAPAIFRQPRAGRHGRVFTIYKFRTMRDAYDAQGHPLPDEQRLTPFGRALRAMSLDELPQLWNILRGDMSLIGPRPLLVRYLPRYSPEQARRHELRPGVTGWAQVHGRNELTWEEKFALDVWYVDHCSLRVDLATLIKTATCVLSRRGVSADQHVTMGEFMGTAPLAHASNLQEPTS